MILLEEQDFYKVIQGSLIADYDYQTVINFYQPIIGYKAAILYFTLIEELHYQEWSEINTHENLLKKMQISLGDFLDARKKLEAIGLVRSFRKENEDGKAHFYIYKLYAPKTVNEFVNDPCFAPLLASSISFKEFNKIKNHYHKNEIGEEYDEISAHFKDEYQVLNSLPKDMQILSRTSGDISSGFKQKDFFEAINKFGIKKEAFNREQLYQIERIALLFGINEKFMGELVFASFDKDASPNLDIDKLYMSAQNSIIYPTNKKNGDNDPKIYEENNDFAIKINKMNTTSPYEYFRQISNQQYPSPSDIAILNDLSNKYHLSIGVINCLVYYTLEALDMSFPRPYCEKLASNLARKGVSNAMEAYNILYGSKKKVKYKTNEKEDSKDENKDEEEISVEDLKKLAEEIK